MNIDVNSTAVILSKENASLKEKIKDLQAEIEKLSQEIEKLRRLSTIRRIACYDTGIANYLLTMYK